MFAQFAPYPEIVLASHLFTRETVPACAVVTCLHWPAFLPVHVQNTMVRIALCVYVTYCLTSVGN